MYMATGDDAYKVWMCDYLYMKNRHRCT